MSKSKGITIEDMIVDVQDILPRMINEIIVLATATPIPPIIAFLYSFRIYFTSFMITVFRPALAMMSPNNNITNEYTTIPTLLKNE